MPMHVKAEHILPYAASSGDKTEQVRTMFDAIARRYDMMNLAMTGGLHLQWQHRLVHEVAEALEAITSKREAEEGGTWYPRILDVATGTGALAMSLARHLPHARIQGVDLSEGMLEVGRRKIAQAGLEGHISLRQADCLALPYTAGEFDAVTVAYGVRNFEHLDQGFSEMARVLRPGGILCVLELSVPENKHLLPAYGFYTRRVVPLLGRMIAADPRAYQYLPQSIAAMPRGNEMLRLLEEAGLKNARRIPLTFGVCTLFMAQK